MVVYGHTPTPQAEWINNTICIDTGCVFGGSLTALRYPERDLVSVPAKHTYYEPAKPFLPDDAAAVPIETRSDPEVLDVEDVLGSSGVQTRLAGRVTIPPENAAAALEVMSRFAVDPRWLIYLPPTMAPTATTEVGTLLEHPAEAFASFRSEGIPSVICEEKHMGSRAIVIVCRSSEVAQRRFVPTDAAGLAVTRTGRRFFSDPVLERAVLERVSNAVADAGLWEELETDWLLLDAEIMPWSLKADELLRSQYASVGAAATHMLDASVVSLAEADARGVPVGPILDRTRERDEAAHAFVRAYQPYQWPVDAVTDVKVAPFQVLAGEGRTFLDRDHGWHLAIADRLAAADPDVIRTTGRVLVDVTDETSQAAAIDWWTALTSVGGEGMVVKPMEGIVRGRRGIMQPGIKCRGPSICGSSTAPSTASPRIWSGSGSGRSAASEGSPCASSRSGWRRSSVSRVGNHAGVSTSACSASWRWRANRSIPASSPWAGRSTDSIEPCGKRSSWRWSPSASSRSRHRRRRGRSSARA